MRKVAFGALCLAMMFTLVLAACSGKGNEAAPSNDTNTGAPATTTAPASETTPAEADDPYAFPLKDKLTLTIMAGKQPATVADYNDLDMFKQLEEKTNVHIDWKMIDFTARSEQYNLMLASGNYPDAIYGYDLLGAALSGLARDGVAIPLNDLIDKYAPNLSAAFDKYPQYKRLVTHPDGKIYSLPHVWDRPFQVAPDIMYINKKWLDQLGLPVPTTLDELTATLKKFKENDMNGNGKQDEIPMSFLNRSHWLGGHSFAMSFDVMDPAYTHTYIKDGKVLYAPEQEGWREYVEFLHGLYKDGLLDNEFLTMNTTDYYAKLQAEAPILGVLLYPQIATNGQDYVPMVGLKGPEGYSGWTKDLPYYSTGSFVITSANKSPEATMKWIDSHYDLDFGIEMAFGPKGVVWDKKADGTYERLIPEYPNSEVYKTSPSGSGPKLLPADIYMDLPIPESEREAIGGVFNQQIVPLLKYDPLNTALIYNLDDVEALQDVTADLNGYSNTIFADFVVNGVTNDKWAKHLDQLKKIGLDKYLEIHSKYQLK